MTVIGSQLHSRQRGSTKAGGVEGIIQQLSDLNNPISAASSRFIVPSRFVASFCQASQSQKSSRGVDFVRLVFATVPNWSTAEDRLRPYLVSDGCNAIWVDLWAKCILCSVSCYSKQSLFGGHASHLFGYQLSLLLWLALAMAFVQIGADHPQL